MKSYHGLTGKMACAGAFATLAWAGGAMGQPPSANAGHDTTPPPPVVATVLAHPVTANVTVSDPQLLNAEQRTRTTGCCMAAPMTISAFRR